MATAEAPAPQRQTNDQLANMAAQGMTDEQMAHQLQAEENQFAAGPVVTPTMQIGVTPQMFGAPIAGGQPPMVQGVVVQGGPPGSGGGGPVQTMGVPIQPGGGAYGPGAVAYGPGPVAYGGMPMGIAYAEPMIPAEELIVLRYRCSMSCFASIDFVSNLLWVITAITPKRDTSRSADQVQRATTIFGVESDGNLAWMGLIGLCFLVGPICGMIGARTLKRGLVTVYLVFSITKMVFQVAVSIDDISGRRNQFGFFWLVIIALIQVYITRIVFKFWLALGAISLPRRKELLDPHVLQNTPVAFVWR